MSFFLYAYKLKLLRMNRAIVCMNCKLLALMVMMMSLGLNMNMNPMEIELMMS